MALEDIFASARYGLRIPAKDLKKFSAENPVPEVD
jgi:hypothetical protein